MNVSIDLSVVLGFFGAKERMEKRVTTQERKGGVGGKLRGGLSTMIG